MLEKMKENANKIIFVCAIIAGGLLLPNLSRYFTYDFSVSVIISVVSYSVILAADILLAVFAFGNKKLSDVIALPLLLILGALLLNNVYPLFNGSESFENVPYIALYVAIIVMYFVSLTNKKLSLAFYVLYLILVALYIASTFGGSIYGLSLLLSIASIGYMIYSEKKENEGEKENEQDK